MFGGSGVRVFGCSGGDDPYFDKLSNQWSDSPKSFNLKPNSFDLWLVASDSFLPFHYKLYQVSFSSDCEHSEQFYREKNKVLLDNYLRQSGNSFGITPASRHGEDLDPLARSKSSKAYSFTFDSSSPLIFEEQS